LESPSPSGPGIVGNQWEISDVKTATTSTDPAGTLGIDVPDRLLALADEVIE